MAIPSCGNYLLLGGAQSKFRWRARAREATCEKIEQLLGVLLHDVARLALLHQKVGRALPDLEEHEHLGQAEAAHPALLMLARGEKQIDARQFLVEKVNVLQHEIALSHGQLTPLLHGYVLRGALLVLGDQAQHELDLPPGLHQAHDLDHVAESLRDAAR